MTLDNIFSELIVIELANVLAGPSVGAFFSELGATVIKIKNRSTGGLQLNPVSSTHHAVKKIEEFLSPLQVEEQFPLTSRSKAEYDRDFIVSEIVPFLHSRPDIGNGNYVIKVSIEWLDQQAEQTMEFYLKVGGRKIDCYAFPGIDRSGPAVLL